MQHPRAMQPSEPQPASGFRVSLLADAESAEDAVQDVVGGGGAGDGVDGPQRCVEIQQQHLVRDANTAAAAFSIRDAFAQ